MQLHPQMKAILDQAAASGGKPFHSMTPVEARQGITALLEPFNSAPEKVAANAGAPSPATTAAAALATILPLVDHSRPLIAVPSVAKAGQLCDYRPLSSPESGGSRTQLGMPPN